MKFLDRLNYAQKMKILFMLFFLIGLFCGMGIGIWLYRNELLVALQECLSRDLTSSAGGFL